MKMVFLIVKLFYLSWVKLISFVYPDFVFAMCQDKMNLCLFEQSLVRCWLLGPVMLELVS